MTKAATNKMAPKTEHTTSQAMKAKCPCDMAPTAHVPALLSRHQFIAGLVDFTSRQSLVTKAMSRQPTNLDKFTPFDSVFLFSAPEQTIALMAKLCIRIGARTTILTIPTELRLKICEYAIEGYWERHEDNHPPLMAFRMWDLKVKEPLEPSFLRTCKLFRMEGIEAYKKFLQEVCDSRKRYIEHRKEMDEQRRIELSRQHREDGSEIDWLVSFLLETPDYCCFSPFTHDGRKAANAETELKRLHMLEQNVPKKKQRRTRRKVTRRTE